MKINKMILGVGTFLVATFLFINCSSDTIAAVESENETTINFEYYRIDLSKSFTDLSDDERFKDLTNEQILAIMDYYSPGEESLTEADCNNCVYHVRSFDNRLMPVNSGCNITYKWTNTGCLGGKKKLINSCTPAVGSAIIMDTGISAGHVAYIESVVLINPNPVQYSIKINEGNRPSGVCRTIWISSTDNNVVGYQNPNIGINCNNAPFSTCSTPYSSCN
ncbi:hypothetical protein IMCC3317_27720 [Kordia antarctica]|uniref:Peptidase C51 domain-containing protein n=1 Tax=Kordia antarctica TaxID=1218801 RepID=A0A7L4ZKZ1_9FLAO|nr:CHAP domain-containing protein [Kordia antarctica]QHI37393.1 hypothetical protein IMCC3317_27720 [Kordia antarctica]